MKKLLLLGLLAGVSVGCVDGPGAGDETVASEAAVVGDGADASGALIAAATRDDNMALGNPSGATTSVTNKNNFLMVKPQYALSYNNARGAANWVSWHLSTAWKGDAPRSTSFKTDTSLPTGFLRVATSFYTNSGFDRGHLCPSEDRDATAADNAATFLMTNVSPQSPDSNRSTWKELETYARTLMGQGNELYIIAGGRGAGGTGLNGTFSTIHGSDVTVPSHFWKVLVVLPVGSNDVSRVTTATRVIAI
ncbi:MAG TPA: DNA/RNA non-specific endonuclease, partial [Polyangiaceae bacterium]|nr:DNA/RNA non-specific endonuclease [Polyangiaceae bacterium]